MGRPPAAEKSAGPWTWEDFVGLDEDDLRELIDGQLLEVEEPTEIHEHIVALLIFFLTGWVRQRDVGRVYASGYKLRVSAKRGVMPDIQLYREGSLPMRQQQGLIAGRPDLVVEVVSPSSRRYDRVVKLRWYATLGVPEYWIVEPEARTLERLVLREGHYLIADSLADDAVFQPDSFEGLTVPLAELWKTPAQASEGEP